MDGLLSTVPNAGRGISLTTSSPFQPLHEWLLKAYIRNVRCPERPLARQELRLLVLGLPLSLAYSCFELALQEDPRVSWASFWLHRDRHVLPFQIMSENFKSGNFWKLRVRYGYI